MKLILNKNLLNMLPEQFLRSAGYGYIRDSYSGHDSFVRRLSGNFYPRLHMYMEERDGRVIFNLHLDQKQASYSGSHMHNAEYEGEVVEREMARLKTLLMPVSQNTSAPSPASAPVNSHNDLLEKIGHGNIEEYTKPLKKKSWWRRWLNI